MQFFSHLPRLVPSPFFQPKPSTLEGYLSKRFGRIHWIVRTHHSFLIPFLEQITGTPTDALLTKPLVRRHRYKKMGEFEITQGNEKETYLVKIYNYKRLSQKIKQLLRHTRGFHEFYTTYLAARRGIPVEVPVACGEQKYIFTTESYVIIRKIENSCSMREYLMSAVALKERRDVLKKFGELARNMYESGIRQDAFSLDNFLVYRDETGSNKIILIDFEMVSIQTKGLKDKLRIWYLAKLNRDKSFTNTDRIRFLLSYTNGDFIRCKKLARQIKELTVCIQKKDATKSSRLCVRENRTFGSFQSDTFFGYYRKKYTPETLVTLVNALEETTGSVFYRDQFQILHFKEHAGPGFHYRNTTRAWMKANALFAVKIDVPVPVGIIRRRYPALPRETFLISQMPDNCISLSQYPDFYADENHVVSLVRFAEQVSFFGVFSKDLHPQDILIQEKGKHQGKCYLGNYTSFQINQRPVEKNKSINTNIVKKLLETYR